MGYQIPDFEGDSTLTKTQRKLLQVCSEHTNDKGRVTLSVTELAEQTGVNRKTVQRAFKAISRYCDITTSGSHTTVEWAPATATSGVEPVLISATSTATSDTEECDMSATSGPEECDITATSTATSDSECRTPLGTTSNTSNPVRGYSVGNQETATSEATATSPRTSLKLRPPSVGALTRTSVDTEISEEDLNFLLSVARRTGVVRHKSGSSADGKFYLFLGYRGIDMTRPGEFKRQLLADKGYLRDLLGLYPVAAYAALRERFSEEGLVIAGPDGQTVETPMTSEAEIERICARYR